MTTTTQACSGVGAPRSSPLSVPLTAIICFGVSVLCAAPALAQSQGRVLRDGTIIWRADSTLVAAIAKAGTILDVTARSDGWYKVIIPEALGGRGERGLIASIGLELVPGTPEPPLRPLRSQSSAPREEPRAGPADRHFLMVNGGYQLTSHDFDHGTTLVRNSENGRVATNYSVKSGPSFDVAGGAMVSRWLGVGIGVSWFSRTTPATLSASIPHPFFFNQPRSVSADVGGLRRQELAFDLQVRGVLPVWGRLQVALFGGPSFFLLKQDAITDFTYADAYPYDQATFGEAQTDTATRSKVGVKAGGDVAFFFTRKIGIGFTAAFSHARIDLPSLLGEKVAVEVGGTQAGLGLRLRF